MLSLTDTKTIRPMGNLSVSADASVIGWLVFFVYVSQLNLF